MNFFLSLFLIKDVYFLIVFADSLFRHTNNTQNSTNVRPHTTAELPKLHSRSDTLRRNSARHENITNYGKTANLPTIKKQEIGDELRLAKARNERRKIFMQVIFN
jgi:uncharacterized Zn-finger protein